MKGLLGILCFIYILGCKNPQDRVNSKPIWIFILAGQSNMAGRGLLEVEDTSTHPDVLVLDSMDNWIIAQEPLHYYEPVRRGLHCGMAFAREMIRLNRDSIRVGLVPCAVGGSSVELWLYDSTYRGVKLFSNFSQKVSRAKQKGTIKGILWHQGESNLNTGSLSDYSRKLDSLFIQMRTNTGLPSLPIVMGDWENFWRLMNTKAGRFNLIPCCVLKTHCLPISAWSAPKALSIKETASILILPHSGNWVGGMRGLLWIIDFNYWLDWSNFGL